MQKIKNCIHENEATLIKLHDLVQKSISNLIGMEIDIAGQL
jgi:hypothetical protein